MKTVDLCMIPSHKKPVKGNTLAHSIAHDKNPHSMNTRVNENKGLVLSHLPVPQPWKNT